MEFKIEHNAKYYKVVCVEDCNENNGGLWCMVYKGLGIGYNPYNYGEMEYEEDYSDDFCIHPDDCDCKDDEAVEAFINKHFETI